MWVQFTVAPRNNEPSYSEDPVITNNIWKPGRITVKYVKTNRAIMKSSLWQIGFDIPNASYPNAIPMHDLPRYNKYFVCVETNQEDDH